MKNHFKRYLLIFAGTCAWISAQAQIVTTDYKSKSIFGFTTSGLYDPTDSYQVGGQDWVANLLPLQVTYRRAVSDNFLQVLSAAYPGTSGWRYASAVNELAAGSLVVHTYDVIGTPNKVGAELHLEYIPAGADPTTNLHWIQVVTNNHANRQPHGTMANNVDNGASPGGRSPYYDDGGAANGRDFYDFPFRSDGNQSHIWQAELFLVSGPPPGMTGLVTFYGGVAWGWENHPVPEPSTIWFTAGLILLVMIKTLRARRMA